MSTLFSTSLKARWTLQKLRPPSRKKLFLLESFSFESKLNLGCVYRLETGESALAAGDGLVITVRLLFPAWKFTPGDAVGLATTYEVTVDHGNGVWTVVHGLASITVKTGQTVKRGDVLGPPLTSEIFFQVKWTGQPYDPASISRHFQVQDGQHAVGRTGYIREAPDLLLHNFFDGIRMVVLNGVRYFVNVLGSKPAFLLNIDFNGTGAFTGPGVVGNAGDYWNVYTPVVFTEDSRGCYCGEAESNKWLLEDDSGFWELEDSSGDWFLENATVLVGGGYDAHCFVYSSPAVVNLQNYAGVSISTWLERVAPVSGTSGTTPTWTSMLSTWIGGYSGGIPLQTMFRLHSLPPGTYELYLYSDQTDSGFGSDYYVRVDAGSILHAATAPTGAVTWVQNDNYVLFSNLVIVPGSIVQVEVLGFLAGLQMRRI